ncbi:hypothetical protein ACQKDS_14630 [Serratia sp. NPDC078593]|uniref:hypothetical protein n=1 Tax=unclassified Serratia (in: enterobacteria) TaxID=2647522 RepID=UPI0037D72C61
MHYSQEGFYFLIALFSVVSIVVLFFVIRYAVMSNEIIKELKLINEKQDKQIKITSAILDNSLKRD